MLSSVPIDTDVVGVLMPLPYAATPSASECFRREGARLYLGGESVAFEIDTPYGTGRHTFHLSADADVHPWGVSDIGAVAYDVPGLALAPTNVLVYPHREVAGAFEIASVAVSAPLASIVEDLRQKVDLPVQDIARMCGVGRRQFYNLLDGSTRSPQQEQHIRLVHELVLDLHSRLGNGHAVRAAILTPIDEVGYESFFDAASRLEGSLLVTTHQAIVTRIDDGERLRKRVAPSGTFPRVDPTWEEAEDFLRGYPRGASDSGRE